MRLDIDLRFFEREELYVSPEPQNLGWSYFNVYSLNDFKNIYNVYYNCSEVRSIPSLLEHCKRLGLVSETGKKWTRRNLLEIVNALKKTGLLDIKTSEPLAGSIFDSNCNGVLTRDDIQILRNVFFSYFRFRDFLNVVKSESGGFIISYMYDSRFFNRFLSYDKKVLYSLDESKQTAMRFWDVFTKWGMSLRAINKCSLMALNIDCCCYEIQNGYLVKLSEEMPKEFDILQYINNHFSIECVYIPDVERELIIEYGFHIDDIKDAIVKACISNSDKYRLQRITEIFIGQGERSLFPFLDGTYMSHILKL